MAQRRYSKRTQQRELNITLVVLAVIIVGAGLGSISQSTLLLVTVLIICVATLGAAAYYYFVYRHTLTYQAGLRQLQIADVDNMSGVEFEKYVADLFRRQGYMFETTALSGDLGVDLIIIKDGVRTAVQTKRYSKPVNQAAIREAVAGMKHYKCTQAMVVTNNRFTRLAVQLARDNNCELVDRDKLIELIATRI